MVLNLHFYYFFTKFLFQISIPNFLYILFLIIRIAHVNTVYSRRLHACRKDNIPIVLVIADLVGDAKLTKDSKPPLPKVHSTPKKPSTPKAAEVRKPTEKLIKNAKSSPRITPKATPLQSPGVEHAPLIRETNAEIIKQDEGKETQDVKSEDKNEEKKDQGSEKTQVNLILR